MILLRKMSLSFTETEMILFIWKWDEMFNIYKQYLLNIGWCHNCCFLTFLKFCRNTRKEIVKRNNKIQNNKIVRKLMVYGIDFSFLLSKLKMSFCYPPTFLLSFKYFFAHKVTFF